MTRDKHAAPSMHERMRRLAGDPSSAVRSALDDLSEGGAPVDVARDHGLPLARVLGTRSFYDLLTEGGRPHTGHLCTGTACWAARGSAIGSADPADHTPVRCLGRCYEAPVATGPVIDHEHRPITVRSLGAPIAFRHLLGAPLGPSDLAALYALPDPNAALSRLVSSGLRGRGGAAYPTAAKWRVAREAAGPRKAVVANGDEGDPGSYVDRLLLERAPHAVLAGMNLCAHVIGATDGIVFIRGEYPEAARRVRAAIDEASGLGLWRPGFSVSVKVGAGSYVCGEETALIKAIEGQRAESQVKPPYPAERGLWGWPTIVQNVETLALVPWVGQTGLAPDQKAFSLSGALVSPAAVEAPFGTTLRTLLEDGGGGAPPGSTWTMALVGGPMGRLIPERDFDVKLGYDTLPGLGHGGVVVFDGRTSARALAHHLFAFAAAESCGACAPCRIGTSQLARVRDREGLLRLLTTLELGSLCGFGQGVPRPLRDLMAAFPDAVLWGAP